jgi:hypothetical protein
MLPAEFVEMVLASAVRRWRRPPGCLFFVTWVHDDSRITTQNRLTAVKSLISRFR